MAKKETPAKAKTADAEATPLSNVPRPRLHKLRVSNFRCIGPTPVEIELDDIGLELVEMNRSKENAFCCGGGGENFFTDLLGSGPESPARSRVREAAETGAAILAVACPNCAKMLEDAVKAENLEEKIAVKDIAEIIQGGQI